jgi:hypothetical protein
MIAPCPITADQVRGLEGLLDEEAALLVLRHSQLGSLCAAIIERDESAVERILDQIEQAQQLQTIGDQKVAALRTELAGRLGVDAGALRLSGLIDLLPPRCQAGLRAKRTRVLELAERFGVQHMRTVMLLSECARINRMLLEGLFPRCQAVTTYGAGGRANWRAEAGLVDMES